MIGIRFPVPTSHILLNTKGRIRKEEGWMMRRTMLLVLTAAMVMALTMVAMALPVFAGGADDEEENDNGAPTVVLPGTVRSSFAAGSILITVRVRSL